MKKTIAKSDGVMKIEEKKYNKSDINQFIFKTKNPKEKNLAQTYKKYLYG